MNRIALVYHAPTTRDVLALWLRYAGYEVLDVRACDAVEILAEQPRPNLIILDYDLPSGRGSALLAELRATEPVRGVPILALTAEGAPAEQPVDASLVTGWLAKPCDFGELSIWLVRLLGSPLKPYVSP